MKTRIFAVLLWSIAWMLRGQLVETAKNDINLYLRHYAQPAFEANLYNFAEGWSHGAGVLKPWHLKLDISAAYTFIPSSKQEFVFESSCYNYLRVLDSVGNETISPVNLPTFAGGSSPYRLELKIPASVPGTYDRLITDVPPGYRDEIQQLVNFLPVGLPGAMVQLNMGLPAGFEVMLRFLPKLSFGDLQTGLTGLGLKYDIGRWIFKKDSRFSWSWAAAYTAGNIRHGVPELEDFEAQFDMRLVQFQTYLSYRISVLNLYVRAGYLYGTSSFMLKGETTYSYDVVDENGDVLFTYQESISDPVDLQYQLAAPEGALGILLNLKYFHIFAQYNLNAYTGLHAGISFTY